MDFVFREVAKVGIVFVGSDELGNPTELGAGWWVAIDHVAGPDSLSGTLASKTRDLATLSFGERLWLRRENILEVETKKNAE